MTITTFDQFIGSAKQYLSIAKLSPRTAVATGWFSVFDVTGNPGGGALAGTSTASGVVPTDATAGFPPISAFGGGTVGYLAQVEFGSSIACRMKIFDQLFKAGAYSFAGGTTTLSTQPSYASRIPDSNYSDTQIWIEVSTAFTVGNNWQVQVTYTNQDGTTGRTSAALPATAAAGLTLGRMYQIGLQAGDSGVRTIESVIVTNGATAMTAGAFNVLVLRPLWSGRVAVANSGDVHDLAKTGMPVLFADSALYLAIAPDTSATGVPEIEMVIANG